MRRGRCRLLSSPVLLISLTLTQQNYLAAATLLGSNTGRKGEGFLISGTPVWATCLIVVAMAALVVGFLWGSAIRAWISSFFARSSGAVNNSNSDDHQDLEIPMAAADGPRQSATMVVAPPVEEAPAGEIASSGERGRRREREDHQGKSSRAYAVLASSLGSALGSTSTSPPGGRNHDIHSSSTDGGGRRLSDTDTQLKSPISQPTNAFIIELTGGSFDGHGQGKNKQQRGEAR